MFKTLLCLILLFNLYNCETFEGVKVYEIKNNANSEQSINVNIGDEFALKFRGNPTTGYTWVLLNPNEGQSSLLGTNFENDGSGQYVPDSTDKFLCGGGGSFYYKFQALKPSNGEIVLRFSYRRVWSKQSNKLPETLVKITVN